MERTPSMKIANKNKQKRMFINFFSPIPTSNGLSPSEKKRSLVVVCVLFTFVGKGIRESGNLPYCTCSSQFIGNFSVLSIQVDHKLKGFSR